ncbi:SMP-30/gluconolactonase/LRE family protein [Acuticoccus kandeliae]|uniref:SMP-30/gluconolactonase/LRE family protein n=1 Tax=Acuticoccus kandeliae TaxID=2073160 RepID=UPI00196B9473|nr:SMP-30/gluconolactonase/LRE family protein [Acuticoccus kandeliae]
MVEPQPAVDGDEVGHAPGTQALARGLQIMEVLGATPGSLRFTDLQDRLGLPKGSLHRLLATLIESGYVAIEARDQTYRLGSRLFELAHRVWDTTDLRGAAEPEMERLKDLTGEAVRLGILDADTILYVDQRDVPHAVRVNSAVGGRAPLHASALGKAMLAHLPTARRAGLLARLELSRATEHTITDREALARELDLIKGRGYAMSVEETHDGVNAVAAPVLDHRAEPIGAIGVVAPAFRLPGERLHALGRDVIEAARRISGNAGESAMSISVNPRPLHAVRDDVSVAIPSSAFLGEGPHWDSRTGELIWVDILAPAVIRGDVATGTAKVLPVDDIVGVAVPRAKGGFLLATQNGIKTFDPETGVSTLFADPEADRPGNRFNDGKCDRRGRFWVGSLALNTTPDRGALWRVDSDGSAVRMDDRIHVSNGLGWSPDDRTFYFTDSGRRTIYAYDFDIAAGTVANRRIFAEITEASGTPDGLTVDAEGFVWCAHWDGWCVTRYDPDGKVERVIDLPVPRPTSCVFGGADLSTLYVTTARIRLSAGELKEAPLSGSVFAIHTNIKGLPETPFAG